VVGLISWWPRNSYLLYRGMLVQALKLRGLAVRELAVEHLGTDHYLSLAFGSFQALRLT
jgi:hypothetical protein